MKLTKLPVQIPSPRMTRDAGSVPVSGAVGSEKGPSAGRAQRLPAPGTSPGPWM